MKRLLLLPALLCLVVCLLLTAVPAPLPVSAPAPAAPRLLALTFDDGPHPTCTDRILDTLAAYDPHATFFVLGSKIESYFRMGCSYARGDLTSFVTRPISLIFILVAVYSVVGPIITKAIKNKKAAKSV